VTGALGGATVAAALGPDRAWAYYLTLGMVATVNPCGFAMLPAYLSYFLGLDDRAAQQPQASVGQAMRVACAVAGGFLAVFAVAGAIVELTSLPLYENVPWLSIFIGGALFVLGVAMLFGFEPTFRLPRLDRGGRQRTVGSMFVFGVSYAVASIGCTLPLFLGAVAGTMTGDSLVGGLAVFAVYGLGMTLVLLALTVAIALARTSLVRSLRRAQPYVGRVVGGLVALAGAYVAYYGWLEVRLGRTGAVTGSNVTETVYGWSSDLTGWIDRMGSVRIGVVVAILLAGTVMAVRAARSSGDSSRSSHSSDRPEGDGPEGGDDRGTRSTTRPGTPVG
jgi:cytochrome c-type biogenesis protein